MKHIKLMSVLFMLLVAWSVNGSCPECKEVQEGPLKGVFSLDELTDNTCPGKCLYVRWEDGRSYCFHTTGYETLYPTNSCNQTEFDSLRTEIDSLKLAVDGLIKQDALLCTKEELSALEATAAKKTELSDLEAAAAKKTELFALEATVNAGLNLKIDKSLAATKEELSAGLDLKIDKSLAATLVDDLNGPHHYLNLLEYQPIEMHCGTQAGCHYIDTDFNGSVATDLELNNDIKSIGECSCWCQKVTACVAWVYAPNFNGGGNSCWLKSHVNAGGPYPKLTGLISAKKTC